MQLDTRAARVPPSAEALEISFADLAEDFDQQAHLARSMSGRVRLTHAELVRARRHLHGDSLDLLEDQLRWFRSTYDRLHREVIGLRWEASRGRRSIALLEGLARRKRSVADQLRALQSSAAATITASDWQSPTYDHALYPSAGRHTGRVTEHLDDYKRDRHPDAAAFEERYLREYVQPPPSLRLRALMTSSGMSAFTTILGYLTMERLARGSVIVGSSVYHECRDLIRASDLGRRVREVSESPPDLLPRAIEELRPRAVFLDPLCNAKGVHVADVAAVIDAAERLGDPCMLVIDNTALSCSFRPFSLLPEPARHVRAIVFESLTKYPQLGLDRATAGMIVAGVEDASALDAYREHLGTNVPDVVVHAIPEPSRPVLLRRLERLERNASILAARLHEEVERSPRVVEGVGHPALADHPCHEVARTLGFAGGFLSLDLAESFDRTEVHRRFVRLALDEARRRGVALGAGASFGFDTARVYVTGTTAGVARPFIRVAAGTEHLIGAAAVGAVLAEAVGGLRRR